MVHLDVGPFLNELGKLFERNKTKGSVSVTMKRSKSDLKFVAGVVLYISQLVLNL